METHYFDDGSGCSTFSVTCSALFAGFNMTLQDDVTQHNRSSININIMGHPRRMWIFINLLSILMSLFFRSAKLLRIPMRYWNMWSNRTNRHLNRRFLHLNRLWLTGDGSMAVLAVSPPDFDASTTFITWCDWEFPNFAAVNWNHNDYNIYKKIDNAVVSANTADFPLLQSPVDSCDGGGRKFHVDSDRQHYIGFGGMRDNFFYKLYGSGRSTTPIGDNWMD